MVMLGMKSGFVFMQVGVGEWSWGFKVYVVLVEVFFDEDKYEKGEECCGN